MVLFLPEIFFQKIEYSLFLKDKAEEGALFVLNLCSPA